MTHLPVLCSEASFRIILSITWRIERLSLQFVPPTESGGMEITMKYLIITEKANDYFFPYVDNPEIKISNVYNLDNKFVELLMRIKRKLNFDISKYIISNNTETYDCIVFFDCSCDYKNLPYLKGKNRDVRLFIWNLVDDFLGRLKKSNSNVTMDYVKRCFDHVYSFDKNDCEKYNLEYYPPLYCKEINQGSSYEYDTVFLGTEKGRYSILKEIYDILHEKGYKQKFHVFSESAENRVSQDLCLTSKRVTYNEYLEWVKKSRSIIDIPQKGQIGFTIRVMESIFMKKKLLTTCKEIKKYKIYKPNNVFIIGEDDYSSLDDFMKQEYSPVDDNILEYYNIGSWIDNMKNNLNVGIDI